MLKKKCFKEKYFVFQNSWRCHKGYSACGNYVLQCYVLMKKNKKWDIFQIKKKLDPKCFFEKELKLSWGHEITGVCLLKVINSLRKLEQMNVVTGEACLPFSKAQILSLEPISEMPWLAMICRSQLEQVNAICISI